MARGRVASGRHRVGWRGLGLAAMAVAGAIVVAWLERADLGPVAGHARVIDGDSLRVGRREVRLHGIDAPEGPQTCQKDARDWACGEAARQRLQSLVQGREVICEGVEIDKHDRLLAVCRVAGRDIAREMVVAGLAVSYGRYASEEAEAKAQRNGLWGSQFQRPREWRGERGVGKGAGVRD
ncbi:MAG: thermonuclease family protein [Hyphomicrobiaceae bacterium]|nr:thermonuclease family protein [Hyphomicrobiaceae bacterium]